MISSAMLTPIISVAFAETEEQVLNVAIGADIRGTNPGVNRDGTTDTIHMHLVEGLVAYGEDFSIVPMLAESVEQSDDGLTYTFKLRQDVSFHNNETMKAEHVKWSWDRYMKPETNWRCRNYFTGKRGVEVTSVDVIDDYTVQFKLAEPSAIFLGNLARFDCGSTAILHPDSVDADGNWLKPVGTGPFILDKHKPGSMLELVKFENYSSLDIPRSGYGGKKEVLFDRLRVFVLSEASIVKAAYLAGDIDVAGIEPSDVVELEGAPNTRLDVAETAIWDTLLINSRDPLLKDKKMRQAIAHAISREQVIDVITEGRGRANPSPVPPVSSFFSDTLWESLEYDPEKAKALLKETGYAGEPLEIVASKRSGSYYQRALIIQSMLSQVGINAQLKVLEWGTQLDAYKKGTYQLQSFSYSPRLDPALSFEMITGDASRKVWKDEDAMTDLSQALAISDREKRQALINDLHRKFIDQVPAVGLGHRTSFYAVRDNVSGFQGWGAGKARYWGVKID